MEEKESVRIQDDLYHAVNGEWLKTAVIPADRPTAGGFAELDVGVEKLLIADLRAMAEGKKAISDPEMAKAVLLFKKGLDVERRNQEGLAPVIPALARIQALKDIADLNAHLKTMVLEGDALPLQMGVDVDMKDTSRHCFFLMGPSTILPDTTYYADGNKQGQALLGIYSAMAQKILSHSDLSKEDQELYLNDTLAFDQAISKIVKSQEEWADYVKNYNPVPLRQALEELKPLDFKGLLEGLYGRLPEKLIAFDPRFVRSFSDFFTAATFPLYKHWAYVKTLLGATGYLSETLRDEGGLYRRSLLGLKENPSVEKMAYRVAALGAFDEVVGLYYGKTYFGEEAKKDVVDMVKSIIAMYKQRMAKNDFLQEDTKKEAILKLDKIVIKMGYPDQVQELYKNLTVDEKSSFYEAASTIDNEKTAYALNKLFTPVNRTLWVMPGNMVNACYNPYSNDITFPAAILQYPFYSLKQSRSENLGAIGAVIGHEISHAFDNNGAQCDENGNLHNWWSKTDFKTFKEKTKAMVKEFDGIPFAGNKVNGKLVVSENIADNGGMAVTLAILKTLPDPDYQGYFKAWAKIWCQKAQPQYQQLLLSIDVHSPTELRANMTPRNFPEWYSAFGVTSKDGMYLPEEKRVTIW